jgi:hypothetical protein
MQRIKAHGRVAIMCLKSSAHNGPSHTDKSFASLNASVCAYD